MTINSQIIFKIKENLDKVKPELSKEKKERMYKILNPDIEDYLILGVKTKDIEKIVREVQNNFDPPFKQVKEVFKSLAQSNVEEYKFAAFFFLNRYKKQFNPKIPFFFRDEYFPYCHTWSTCDSCCIRVLGPFLAKEKNSLLAINTINNWSSDNSLWIRRASIVILLKIVMVHKDFDESYIFQKVEEMLNYKDENYIEKAIGWLLKTCSKYKPNIIKDYLIENKVKFSRLILRYASEKLAKEARQSILKK
jgi:3-methyladenine DNA glycosylase AlkD